MSWQTLAYSNFAWLTCDICRSKDLECIGHVSMSRLDHITRIRGFLHESCPSSLRMVHILALNAKAFLVGLPLVCGNALTILLVLAFETDIVKHLA